MMKYRRKRRREILVGIFLGVVALLLVVETPARRAIHRGVLFVSRPVLVAARTLGPKIGSAGAVLYSKRALWEENRLLRRRLLLAEPSLLAVGALRRENEILRNAQLEHRLAASVVAVPPQSPYDILLLDAGYDDGIRRGMRAIAENNVYVGTIVEVFSRSSRLRAVSTPGVMTPVRILEKNILVEAEGKGGGTLSIRIPEGLSVPVGATVVTPDRSAALVGTVLYVEVEVGSSIQTLELRMPVSFRSIERVFVE